MIPIGIAGPERVNLVLNHLTLRYIERHINSIISSIINCLFVAKSIVYKKIILIILCLGNHNFMLKNGDKTCI